MNADPVAALYRWMEYAAFGRALERRRFAYMRYMRDAARCLILGEGDGRFLKRLLEENRKVEVDVIESSAKMIALARVRVPEGDRGRVRFHQGGALQTPPPNPPYDLIVTHFFLDCFTASEIEALIPRLAGALALQGRWLISEFQEPQGRFARLHAQVWLGVMYRFFRVATNLGPQKLPPYAGVLAGAGLSCVAREEARLGLLASELWVRPSAGLR